jgi:hypothetical protein
MAAMQCPRFVQNAWKKDLCSNCFKSKEEHSAVLQTVKSFPTSPLKIAAPPAKSIIKCAVLTTSKKSKKKSVNFPKEVSEIIGYGGEISGSSDASDDDDVPDKSKDKEVVYEEDEHLMKLTKSNTEFNQNNGNLLGDPTSNIKKSFAALKLGAPQKDSAGKKQTLKINVTPFGGLSGQTQETKSKIIPSASKDEKSKNNGIVLKSITSTATDDFQVVTFKSSQDEADKSPEMKSTTEKSLLEEISETLAKKRINVNEKKQNETNSEQIKNDVIKVEIKNHDCVMSAVISTSSNETVSTTVKSSRSITRGNAILKDMEKPKILVFSKSSESSDNSSDLDLECSTTEYSESRDSYENVPDGFEKSRKKISLSVEEPEAKAVQELSKASEMEALLKNKSHFFSNQTVSEMFIAHKPINDAIKKRSESYNLLDNS